MAGQQIDEIRSELARSKESLLDKAKAPVVTAYLKTHPGTAIGAALLAGFVMGISAKASGICCAGCAGSAGEAGQAY